jgi:hypothetical protein
MNDKLKTAIGLLIIICGVLYSIYLGFWVCIAGGAWTIIQVLTGALTGSLKLIGWALAKILFGGMVGSILGWTSVFAGKYIMDA